MRSSHIHPEEAGGYAAIGNKYAIGMHFDPFSNLTDEPFGEASHRLYHALKKQHIDKQRFKVLHQVNHVYTRMHWYVINLFTKQQPFTW